MREGLKTYKFDAPDGEYEIELRFTEPKFKEIGQRVFDIKINGEMKIEKLDLVKEAGMFSAFTKQLRVIAKNMNGIEISFTAHKEQPILTAILGQGISSLSAKFSSRSFCAYFEARPNVFNDLRQLSPRIAAILSGIRIRRIGTPSS
jgi:Malectin domain